MNNSTDQPDLPELQQSVLDQATLDDLIRDIEQCTEVMEVIVKPASGEYAVPETVSPKEGQHLLSEGILRGLQIRYRYQGELWIDTLLNVGNNVQLTRMKLTLE